MDFKFIKKGMIVAAITGVILVPGSQVFAAEIASFLELPKQNNEIQVDENALVNAVAEMKDNAAMEAVLRIESAEEIKLGDMLSGLAFAAVGEEGYLTVNGAADENSDWIGKVYADSSIKIVERDEAWAQIVSGNVTGYIKIENLISGKAAVARAKEILAEKYPETELTTFTEEELKASFSIGETRAEEEARIAAEEAQRKAEEEARIAAEEAARQAELEAKGQAVVEYAKQFLGNPYVYGGTSLTRGTDCSGFVRGVYAHFGISMPRTSYYMRNAGYEVSYSEILPGDVICYPGHVGIYAGNGKIINAIDEAHGIGMSNARYANIITIRRMF